MSASGTADRPQTDGATPPAGACGQPFDLVVLAVTYNSADHLTDLFDSIPASAPGLTPRVLVVDNGSVDDTVAVARARDDITVIESGGNIGYSGGINVGRRHAGRFDALAIVNPDAQLGEGCLRDLVDALADPTVGIAVPVIWEADGTRFASLRREPTFLRVLGESLFGAHFPSRPGVINECYRRDEEYERPRDVDWASGAMLVIAAACDRAVGDWDERYFLYSEETDYARRTRERGFRIRFVPSAEVIHIGGGSGRSPALTALQSVSRIREYEITHGRLKTLAFRGALALRHLLRLNDPGHRLALHHVLSRRSWKALPSAEPVTAPGSA